MNKKLIRLTESDLHKIVKESVGKMLNEMGPRGADGDAIYQVMNEYLDSNIGDCIKRMKNCVHSHPRYEGSLTEFRQARAEAEKVFGWIEDCLVEFQGLYR